MPGSLPSDKAALRRHFAAVRAGIPPTERQAAEAAICQAICALPAFAAAPVICGYVAIRHELDLTPVWEAALRAGKTYALPVTLTDARSGGRMVFRAVQAPGDLSSGRYGIPEPAATCKALPAAALDGALLLVPGLCFDPAGYRLGYGGGYYDRFLSELEAAGIRVRTVGATLAACRHAGLPREAHDHPVDYIIDERRGHPTHG